MGIMEEECEKLLHFALSYHSFYMQRNDIPVATYYSFISHLVVETLALQQPEPAAEVLEAAMEWMHGNLPSVSEDLIF